VCASSGAGSALVSRIAKRECELAPVAQHETVVVGRTQPPEIRCGERARYVSDRPEYRVKDAPQSA